MQMKRKNMSFSQEHIELGKKIEAALKKVAEKLIAEEKARDGYLILADKDGNIKKVAAKDL